MKYQHFSVEERESLQYMWWERKSIRSMAKTLKRSPSAVSRELKRNFPEQHRVYTSRLANERALKKRKSRGRKERLKNDRIRSYVVFHLKRRWSPEQIANAMKADIGEKISHEAIYRFIYAPISYGKPRLGFEDLRPYLRRARKMRQPKGLRRSQRLPKYQGTVAKLTNRTKDKETDSLRIEFPSISLFLIQFSFVFSPVFLFSHPPDTLRPWFRSRTALQASLRSIYEPLFSGYE